MIDEILGKLARPVNMREHQEIKEALTAIYEIGLEVIGDFENTESNKPHGDARNQLKAAQRKAWAKACGVAEK